MRQLEDSRRNSIRLQWDASEDPEFTIEGYSIEIPDVGYRQFTRATEIDASVSSLPGETWVLIKSCSRDDINSCESPAYFRFRRPVDHKSLYDDLILDFEDKLYDTTFSKREPLPHFEVTLA